MATPIQYCKVEGCRFSNFHTTVAHRCGVCNQYGHGQIECGDYYSKMNLSQYIEDHMPNHRWCTFTNCTYQWSHSSDSHHCYICGARKNHSPNQCPVNNIQRGGGREDVNEGGINIMNNLSGAAAKNSDTPEIINKQCPMCRETSDVNLNLQVFTEAPCCVCMDTKPKIIFSGCKHANICRDCVTRI